MNTQDHYTEIANLLFPEKMESVEHYVQSFPPRNLAPGACVTRFSPSPTGFVHIGGLFAATVSQRIAHQSGGIFYLRIEDTDKKREVDNGVEQIIDALDRFGLARDEGATRGGADVGAYGPYKQSDRKQIYIAFAKHLVQSGHAYPCFCTPEELEVHRKDQEAQKIRPGYYGTWAVHRDITLEDVKKNLAAGKPFAVRLKSFGSEERKIPFVDVIKGEVSVTENDQDVVLLKSDGLPTYHFAHVIDDYLMHTTHVLRGDEWLSSLPIHIELFRVLGWPLPLYGHISPILKLDGGNKRKLSKRKDPESAVSYYLAEGYPNESVFEYLLNIANSDFEDWRKANPGVPNTEFTIKLEKFSKSGALFDLNKLTDISKDVIATMSAREIFDRALEWASEYDTEFARALSQHEEYALTIFGIERSGQQPRKDVSKWSDVKEQIFYFFDELFAEHVRTTPPVFPEKMTPELVKKIVSAYLKEHNHALGKEEWSAKLKVCATELGFAPDMKTYKQNPASYNGHIGDVAMVLRIALTSKSKTPDLYEIMQTMGEERVRDRLSHFS